MNPLISSLVTTLTNSALTSLDSASIATPPSTVDDPPSPPPLPPRRPLSTMPLILGMTALASSAYDSAPCIRLKADPATLARCNAFTINNDPELRRLIAAEKKRQPNHQHNHTT